MRMTTVIAALRSWVKSLWPFASNAGSGPEQQLAGDTRRETPSEPDGPPRDPPSSEVLDEDRQPDESNPTSVESTSGSSAADKVPPCSAEAESDEPSSVAPPADDDAEFSPPKSGEHPEVGEPDGSVEGDASAGNSRKTKRKPRRISGRRGRQPGNPGKERRQSPYSRPELVCRRVTASATWEVILSADEECQLAAAHLEGEPLDFTRRQCRVPSLRGRLIVSSRDGREHVVPLFEGKPLIFKLRKNWAGEGRRITRITSGHFIVIALNAWQRTGHAPVEPDGCADAAFRAHYFHRDATAADGDVGGFREWSASSSAGIELTGRRIYDNSDGGELFVGDPPGLKSSPDIAWARVGEETERGWGQNFRPDRQSLSGVLADKEGRFFLRAYASEGNLVDSMAFRCLRDLRRIDVDGAEYVRDTVLVPGKTGYPLTEICFVGMDGATLVPELAPPALQAIAPTGGVAVPPHPGADRISCSLGSGASAVNVVLDLPRLWWRLDDGGSCPGEWRDTPLVMTREEFRSRAYADGTLSLLSKRQASVRAGFGGQPDRPYRRKIDDNRIAIPLDNFVDHAQIDRRLNGDARFNVDWAREIVTLIVITADPLPEIVSFTAEPTTVFGGEEATLEWTTRNAGDARVTMEPDTGVIESDGTCTVRPAETTRYTLTLAISGVDDISRTVTVAVRSAPRPGEQPAARVMSSTGGWRSGKGFSIGEIRDAGLTAPEAADRPILIDRRRRTTHRVNVEAIRSMLDA